MKWILVLLICFSILNAKENLHFVKNEGQVNSDIKYYAQLNGCNIFLKSDGFYYDFYQDFDKNDKSYSRKGTVVKLDFLNSLAFNVKAKDNGTKYNYIKGSDESKWIKNVASSNEIVLENLYEGIDIKMYFDGDKPRYDLIVNENADLSQIKFNFKNVDDLAVVDNSLKGRMNIGKFISNGLYAYQNIDGKKTQVDCQFVMNNKGQIEFKVDNYDKTKKLIIDPLVYSSYMGWNGDDYIKQIRGLDNNKYYVAGVTNSPDFPATEGAYQTEVGFKNDIFIARYNRVGVNHTLEVATFYGGSEDDVIKKMKIGLDNNIYICGETSSINLPMKNSLKSTFGGGIDGFISVFNADLDDIVYSYYVGDTGNDGINDIEIVNNKVFFGGYTTSKALKLTSAYQMAIEGEKDGILGCSKASGSSLEYLSYFGNALDDEVNGISIDALENVYVILTSNSSDWKTYPRGGWMNRNSAYDKTYNGGTDMIIGRFTKGLGILEMLTYFGGKGNDYGIDVIATESKSYYFLGYSEKESSQTIETKPGLYQENNAGGYDMVFGRLSDLISRSGGVGSGNFYQNQDLEISTFIGEKGDDIPYEITQSPDKLNFLITGKTNSSKFPQINTDLVKQKYAGKFDGFALEVNSFGTNLSYSTFIGGADDDVLYSGDYYKDGNILYAGETISNNLFTTGLGATKTRNNIDGIIGHSVKGIFSLNGPHGGEKYCPKTVMNVSWARENFQEGAGFNVYLVNEKLGIYEKLADTVKGTNYNWVVDDEVVPDSSYKILVEHPNGIYGISKSTFIINQSPKILSVESDRDKVCIGDSITLIAKVDGVFNPKFNWKKNNTNLTTTNSGTYTIKDLTVESSGNYSLELVGECNPVASSQNISIDVAPNTKIIAQPTDVEVALNEKLELTVVAEGGELSYQWYLNDGQLSGQTNASLIIEKAQKADEGEYYCMVKGRCGDMQRSIISNVRLKTTSNVENIGDINKFYFDGSNLNAEVKMQYSGNAILKIIDLQGKEVYQSNMYISQGTNKLVIPCEFENGMYLFSIIANENTSSFKFVLAK